MRSLHTPRPAQATSPVTSTVAPQWHPRWLEMTSKDRAVQPASPDDDLVAPDHRFGGGPVPQYTVTSREREVLALLARRYTDAEIAEELSISSRTASHHVASILAKLGVANRRQAGAIAAKLGLG
ncbi:MAG: helix-turn-helix transcriptional regulator [Thermomicrobiales bacterium]